MAAVCQNANFGCDNRVSVEVRMRKSRWLENLRCEYKELPYNRTIIVLVRLAYTSTFLYHRRRIHVRVESPSIHQANILP